MLWDIFIAALALAVTAAYVCRVDHTLWKREPVLHAVNVAGGVAAVWVLVEAGQGRAEAGEGLLLAAALVTLLVTYRWLPQAPQQGEPEQMAAQPVRSDDMRRVAGGADKR